jgi:hypothetical protein
MWWHWENPDRENLRRAMRQPFQSNLVRVLPPQRLRLLECGSKRISAKYVWGRVTSRAKIEIAQRSVCQVTTRIFV